MGGIDDQFSPTIVARKIPKGGNPNCEEKFNQYMSSRQLCHSSPWMKDFLWRGLCCLWVMQCNWRWCCFCLEDKWGAIRGWETNHITPDIAGYKNCWWLGVLSSPCLLAFPDAGSFYSSLEFIIEQLVNWSVKRLLLSRYEGCRHIWNVDLRR